MEQEIWKDIIGYEGLYQISSFGNVKSIGRFAPHSMNEDKLIKDKILKPSFINSGYLFVGLSKLGVVKQHTIHSLVAKSFLNHIPNGFKLVINHKNHIKTDNRIENLEIISNRENSNRKHIPHSSKYTGVYYKKTENKWASQIAINGKQRLIGRFNSEYEAHLAYENELVKHLKD